MPRVSLPILNLAVKTQRYSCHGCGDCCRDFTVQLRRADVQKLKDQKWEAKLGEPVTIKFRGVRYLRQRADGGCIFLQEDGLCRIHAEFGFEEKPIACQLFPFSLTPIEGQVAMGVNFACQSVRANRGADLPSHVAELKRMAGSIPEIEPAQQPPMLTRHLRAVSMEVKALNQRIDAWMRNDEHDLATRLHGLAWVASSLGKAKLEGVREGRFKELLDILFGALPQELELLDNDPPTGQQMKMLRQAAFARVEDPKLSGVAAKGRVATVLGQLGRSRRFASGAGTAPHIGTGWPDDISLAGVEAVGMATDADDAKAIDDLVTRWVRATLLGGRVWGAGYYGWTMVEGLQALVLNIAVAGWLAKLHAHGRGRETVDLEAVTAAISRVDRTAGRAAWLGSGAERARLSYLRIDDGLRRLVQLWS